MTHSSRNYGFALITALLLLIGLTLLGVAALRTSIFDEKAAGNVAFRNSAHNLAEAALKAADAELRELYAAGGFAGRTPPLDPPKRIARYPDAAGSAVWKEASHWTNANSIALPIPGVDSNNHPRYSTEFLQSEHTEGELSTGSTNVDAFRDWYRLTARAVDPVTGAAVVLQQTVGIFTP